MVTYLFWRNSPRIVVEGLCGVRQTLPNPVQLLAISQIQVSSTLGNWNVGNHELLGEFKVRTTSPSKQIQSQHFPQRRTGREALGKLAYKRSHHMQQDPHNW